MNFVILGGNGFIGSYIVDEVLAKGHKVLVYDISKEKYRNEQNGVTYVYGSIKDLDTLREIFLKTDILIHSVSTTVPVTSNSNIEFDIETNLLDTINLFRLAGECAVQRVIYLSSGGAIYGESILSRISETHPTNPISSYGITKLASEKYLHYFSLKYNFVYNIIRPSNPYGPRQNPYSNQGVISVFLGKALRNETIEIWGDGTVSKDYLYVKDLASAIYLASVSEIVNNVFNIGSGSITSINEIVDVIRNVIGENVNVCYKPHSIFDVSQVCLDIVKAQSILNFKPEVPFYEGVSSTWNFIKELKV